MIDRQVEGNLPKAQHSHTMTLDELKAIAASEMNADGILSKAVRLDIVEKARKGYKFTIFATDYDCKTIRASLWKSGDGKRIHTKIADSGKRYTLFFN